MTKRQWRRIRWKIIRDDSFWWQVTLMPFIPQLMEWHTIRAGYSWKQKNHR